MSRVIIDTSAWYALIAETDNNHRLIKKYLTNHATELITPFTVFEEITALVQGRNNKKIALKVGKVIRNLGIHYLTNEEEEESWELYSETGATISYVDCSVVVLARKFNLSVLAFDSDYKKMKLNVIP